MKTEQAEIYREYKDNNHVTKKKSYIRFKISMNYVIYNHSRKYPLVANIMKCHGLFLSIVILIGFKENDMSISR